MVSVDPSSWLDLLDLSVNSKRNMEEYYDNLYQMARHEVGKQVKIVDFGNEEMISKEIQEKVQ